MCVRNMSDGLIDKGYHCFSHSIEVAGLAYLFATSKEYSLEHTLEMVVAGLLHDFDPRQTYVAPNVKNKRSF